MNRSSCQAAVPHLRGQTAGTFKDEAPPENVSERALEKQAFPEGAFVWPPR